MIGLDENSRYKRNRNRARNRKPPTEPGSCEYARSPIEASLDPLVTNSTDGRITDARLEEQTRQAQRMEAIGQLAGGVAHDFNNLMTIVTSYCDLLLISPKIDEASKALLQEIAKAGERAAALTRQLLLFSHKQVLAPKVLDLNAIVTETEKMLRRLIGEDITLTTTLERELGKVKADTGQMEQVIINLAVNSRDAMPMGGKLTVATQNLELNPADALQLELPPGQYVLLLVSDTGCGMGEDVKAHIFEPFFTTKEVGKGTGIGLATVYGIVKQCEGHIAVFSEPGMGATFKIYLPVVETSDTRAQAQRQQSMPRGSETILLVEDEEMVRAIARFALKTCGYTVLEAANGEQALLVEEGHTGSLDLIVTDVVMPKIGGNLLVQQIRSRRPQIKVLYMSGYMNDKVISHGVFQDKVAFLQKPFTPKVLAAKVREVLDSEAHISETATLPGLSSGLP